MEKLRASDLVGFEPGAKSPGPSQKGGWKQSHCGDLCPLSSHCLTPLRLISGCSQGAFHPSDTSVASTHHPVVRRSIQCTAPWCQHSGGLPTLLPPPARTQHLPWPSPWAALQRTRARLASLPPCFHGLKLNLIRQFLSLGPHVLPHVKV